MTPTALNGIEHAKQATPCLVPEAPFVATGMEAKAVIDTGRVIVALKMARSLMSMPSVSFRIQEGRPEGRSDEGQKA